MLLNFRVQYKLLLLFHMGFRTKISSLLPLFIGLFVFNVLMAFLFRRPRSWGGDFWLHLFLVSQQADGFERAGLPSLLVSFDPAGDLSIVSLFSGGLIYSFLGFLSHSLGVSIYWCVVLFIVILFNSLFLQAYFAAKSFNIEKYFCSILGFMPFGFGWIIGDGFGRGAISSMIAGVFTINVVFFFLRSLFENNLQKKTRYLVFSLIFVGLVGVTHLPSFVILIFFGFPIVLLSAYVCNGNFIHTLKYTGFVFGLGALSSALYWLPSIMWTYSSSYSVNDAFQWKTSAAFGTPKSLFWFQREVPSAHNDAWQSWIGDGFNGSTSLIVSQPSLFVILSLVLTALTRIYRSNFVASLIYPLLSIYALVMIVPVWALFPKEIQSLQYNFRLLYLPVAYLVFLVIYLVSKLKPKQHLLKFACVVVVVFEVSQSFIQTKNVVNLSLFRAPQTSAVVWTYDVPVNLVFDSYPRAPFWYAVGEQRANDLITSSSDIESLCGNEIRDVEWNLGWPGQTSIDILFLDSRCVKLPLRIPANWLSVSNDVVFVRDANTLDLIIANNSAEPNTTLSLKLWNPLFIGLYLSASVILMLLMFKPRMKKLVLH